MKITFRRQHLVDWDSLQFKCDSFVLILKFTAHSRLLQYINLTLCYNLNLSGVYSINFGVLGRGDNLH